MLIGYRYFSALRGIESWEERMDAGDAEGRCAGGAALPAAGPEAGRMGGGTGRALGTLGTTLSHPFMAASC